MDATPFFVLVGAVSAANILSFGLLWSLFQIAKREKSGDEATSLHILIVGVCSFFICGGIYLAAS